MKPACFLTSESHALKMICDPQGSVWQAPALVTWLAEVQGNVAAIPSSGIPFEPKRIRAGLTKAASYKLQCSQHPSGYLRSLMLYAGSSPVTGVAAGASAPGLAESAACLAQGPFAPPCGAGAVGVSAAVGSGAGCNSNRGCFPGMHGHAAAVGAINDCKAVLVLALRARSTCKQQQRLRLGAHAPSHGPWPCR